MPGTYKGSSRISPNDLNEQEHTDLKRTRYYCKKDAYCHSCNRSLSGCNDPKPQDPFFSLLSVSLFLWFFFFLPSCCHLRPRCGLLKMSAINDGRQALLDPVEFAGAAEDHDLYSDENEPQGKPGGNSWKSRYVSSG